MTKIFSSKRILLDSATISNIIIIIYIYISIDLIINIYRNIYKYFLKSIYL